MPGACPKGTRSKGMATGGRAADIKKSSTMRNRLLSKKERVGAYLSKQEFMKAWALEIVVFFSLTRAL